MINIDNDQINDQEALNQEAEIENSSDATPVSEETTEEVQEVPEQAESTEEAQPEAESTETEDSSKKGYNNRVRELVAEKKAAEAEAKSLKQKMAELTGSDEPGAGQFQQQQTPPDEPLIKPGEEIDAVELDRRLRQREQRLLQMAESRAELKTRQYEAINRINSEANEVMQQFPELNPDSDNYNRELSDTVTEAAEAYVKANPYSASVKEFVGRLMKPYQGAVTKEVGKATETIAKQVSQAALKPTSIQPKEKSAQEKSIAELEEELGIVQS